ARRLRRAGTGAGSYGTPGSAASREYQRLAKEYRAFNLQLEAIRDLPAETTDRHPVNLDANIGLIGDLNSARDHGAEGVGLYRTEVPFLSYKDFPGEEDQLALYRKVI